MFFLRTPNILVPGDSVFMLLKCMCNNVSTEIKKEGIANKSKNKKRGAPNMLATQ